MIASSSAMPAEQENRGPSLERFPFPPREGERRAGDANSLRAVIRARLDRLLVSAAGSQTGQLWDRLTTERSDTGTASQFGSSLGDSSSRSCSMSASTGRLRVAKLTQKMAPPIEPNFIAHAKDKDKRETTQDKRLLARDVLIRKMRKMKNPNVKC
ncbi:hypothetical protein ISCGN_028586 [Ixodes scapularis]